MKLRTQILGLGLAGAALAAGVGGFGLAAHARLGQSMQQAVQAGEALQASQEADMMHDAIRGDAQRAMLAMLEQQPDEAADAAKALKEHVQTFDKALARLAELPLADETRRQLDAVKPLVQRYTQSADTAIAQWRAADPAARTATQGLQQAFTALETAMASLSDSIEKHSESLKTDAEHSVERTRLALGAALAAITVLMLVLSLLLARRMAAPIDLAVEAAERLAQGDLSGRILALGNDESRQLLTAMSRMQDELTGIIGAVKAGAEQVASASAQIAKGNEELAGRTSQQSGSLDTSADTVRQLGESVRSNADHAAQADALAQGASKVAAQGGEVMGGVVATMTGINDSARKIANIIGTIDGIAFQTNILALNAAVEAARAGEQGRGFAVVAGEVRSLAQRSAAAAREVKALVNASVERVDQGTALVDEAGRTMTQIVEAIGRVTTIVGEISHASTRQGEDVRQVNEAIGFLGQRTQDNATLVQESAMAADSLRDQAQALVGRVAAFKLG